MAYPSDWDLGYIAGRWIDLDGKPQEGKQVRLDLVARTTVNGTAVVDGDGLTLTLDADGQLTGEGMIPVDDPMLGQWNLIPFPVSTDTDTNPLEGAILVTELMPGGAQYTVRLGSQHTVENPLIISSDMAVQLLEAGAYVKPVWWQSGTSIPAGAVPNRDLLYDYDTTWLYAIID